ncbi:hypothetical protein P8452_70095 [Trifolium repens]|nr:hypothetical protein P8452_70095 [Trifolium repens]
MDSNSFSRIKHLDLLVSTTKWLFAAPVLDFPEFRYLLHLKLRFLSFNPTFLFNMLQKCPMLQTLIAFIGKSKVNLVDKNFADIEVKYIETKDKLDKNINTLRRSNRTGHKVENKNDEEITELKEKHYEEIETLRKILTKGKTQLRITLKV